MAEFEIERERIVERPVTERVVEREVPVVRRTTVERRSGVGGFAGQGLNPVSGVIIAVIAILLLLLILGVLV